MRKERVVEINLSKWMNTKSSFVKGIYFNSKNEMDCETFTTKGRINKPDLVIKIDRGYGIEYIAIEVKTSESDRNVLDSGKNKSPHMFLISYIDYLNKKSKWGQRFIKI